jgi:hypothetical protein
MSKGPGSKSGIGVNYRPPGYRAVARRRDADLLAGGAEKKKAPPINPPSKQASFETGASKKAAGAPSAEPGEKPE